jgi:3-oxoacyl-[acyl-carrier protein] reductase
MVLLADMPHPYQVWQVWAGNCHLPSDELRDNVASSLAIIGAQRMDNPNSSFRAALVTGATGGIGKAVATALSMRALGVVLHHYNDAQAAEQLAYNLASRGSQTYVTEANITEWEQVSHMVHQVETDFAPIDILVNCAGVMIEESFPDSTLSTWNQTIATNLTGTFLACRHVASYMLSRGKGIIVNISSQTAFRGAPKAAAYCASKGGIVALTHALARELGPAIRVNAVAPGPIDTPMISPYASGEWQAHRTAHMVDQRIGTPDEVAAAVMFLASDGATYVHGQCLHVDGGGIMGA